MKHAMPKGLRGRFDLWRHAISWGWGSITVLYAIAGVLFVFRDNLLDPANKARLDTFTLIRGWDWHVWALGWLLILVAAASEGCFRGHQHQIELAETKHSKETITLGSEINALMSRTSDLIQQRDALRSERERLENRLADDGPVITFGYIKPPNEGFYLLTDRPVCNVTISPVDSSEYTLQADIVRDLPVQSSAFFIRFWSIPKQGNVNDKIEDHRPTFKDLACDKKDLAGIGVDVPIHIEWWDLKGTRYGATWIVEWRAILDAMDRGPRVRRDPASYRVIRDQATRATAHPA